MSWWMYNDFNWSLFIVVCVFKLSVLIVYWFVLICIVFVLMFNVLHWFVMMCTDFRGLVVDFQWFVIHVCWFVLCLDLSWLLLMLNAYSECSIVFWKYIWPCKTQLRDVAGLVCNDAYWFLVVLFEMFWFLLVFVLCWCWMMFNGLCWFVIDKTKK